MSNKKISNLHDIKEHNISLVLRQLRIGENCSRVSIAHETGINQATITNIVSMLLKKGIVIEKESMASSALGRKPVRLMLNSGKYNTCAVRIKRDNLFVAVYDVLGHELYKSSAKITAYDGVSSALEQLTAIIQNVFNTMSNKPCAIGIALPGPFRRDNSQIMLMSGFSGWENINLAQELNSRFNVPVFLEHDANCAALGELMFGKFKDCINVLYILCDRGVGAGLILDGKIYHGLQGMAGEMGHVSINKYGPLCECGNRGCLELYCSMVALENEYKALRSEADGSTPDEFFLPADEILRRVRSNTDPLADKCYSRIVKNLALGTASIINLLNPELVIFADQIIDGGENKFLPIVKSTLKSILLKDVYSSIKVDVTSLIDDPVLIGAGVMAFDKIFSSPLDL